MSENLVRSIRTNPGNSVQDMRHILWRQLDDTVASGIESQIRDMESDIRTTINHAAIPIRSTLDD